MKIKGEIIYSGFIPETYVDTGFTSSTGTALLGRRLLPIPFHYGDSVTRSNIVYLRDPIDNFPVLQDLELTALLYNYDTAYVIESNDYKISQFVEFEFDRILQTPDRTMIKQISFHEERGIKNIGIYVAAQGDGNNNDDDGIKVTIYDAHNKKIGTVSAIRTNGYMDGPHITIADPTITSYASIKVELPKNISKTWAAAKMYVALSTISEEDVKEEAKEKQPAEPIQYTTNLDFDVHCGIDEIYKQYFIEKYWDTKVKMTSWKLTWDQEINEEVTTGKIDLYTLNSMPVSATTKVDSSGCVLLGQWDIDEPTAYEIIDVSKETIKPHGIKIVIKGFGESTCEVKEYTVHLEVKFQEIIDQQSSQQEGEEEQAEQDIET